MFTSLFWKDAIERVVFTMVQVLLSIWASDGLFDVLNVDWKATASVVLSAGALALLKAILAAKATDNSVSPASFAHDDRGF